MALTDRQKQIKKLLDEGKTPKQIGEQLGITENAVYQQRRRIKAANGSGRKASTGRKTATKTTQRQRPARQRQRQTPQAAATTAAAIKAADPLSEVRRRKQEIDSLLSGTKSALDEAQKAYEAAQKAYETAEGKVKPELERLAAVEALLTGKLQPPKQQQQRRSKPAEAKAETPQPEPTPEPPPEPGPEPGDAKPEAAAQDQAAEAPDEPTEVQPSANGDLGEERPGVPTMPEFAQEDAFAS